MLTKSFEFILPLKINLLSLHVSYDVLDAIKLKNDDTLNFEIKTYFIDTNETIRKSKEYSKLLSDRIT